MQWNFPVKTTVDAFGNEACAKSFEITLVDRNSKNHPCPFCGQIHTFDFEKAEQAVLKSAEEAVRNLSSKRF